MQRSMQVFLNLVAPSWKLVNLRIRRSSAINSLNSILVSNKMMLDLYLWLRLDFPLDSELSLLGDLRR